MVAMNPYLPEGVYIPDGEPHVFGDRVYIYGSCDLPNGYSFCLGDYQVYSAPITDLSDWSTKGVALKRKGPHSMGGVHTLWAPDVMQGNDGKYYMYYCYSWQNLICVASSDYPDGPFEYIGVVHHKDGKPYGHKKGDRHCFDPGAFRDEDGKCYLYSGYSAISSALKFMLRLRGARNVGAKGNQSMRLAEDMMTIEEGPFNMLPGKDNGAGTGFEGHEFYEASSMRKFNGKYYAIYSSTLSHELCYAISDHPMKGFVYGGILCSNADIGFKGNEDPTMDYGNTHGSVERINGKYYVFQHRQTNLTENNRQGIAEEIEMDESGHFKMVENTSYGLEGKPFSEFKEYPAYIACVLKGRTSNRKVIYGKPRYDKFKDHPYLEFADGHQLIRNLCDGAKAGYKYFAIGRKATVVLKLRGSEGTLLLADNESLSEAVEAKFQGSNGFSEIEIPFDFKGNKCPLYISYKGNGRVDLLSFAIRPVDI